MLNFALQLRNKLFFETLIHGYFAKVQRKQITQLYNKKQNKV